MTVAQRFSSFLYNIAITDIQFASGSSSHKGVRECLNKHYHGYASESLNSSLIGSWAKDTQVRPPRDVDVIFKLPRATYDRYQLKSGNKQSQLLQEVKSVLACKYSTTTIRGDGPAVIVEFSGYAVDLVPAFEDGSQYLICHTSNGGSYIKTDPVADLANMRASNNINGGMTRDLIRMLKKWQSYCTAPLKSFQLELLAIDFLATWQYRGKGTIFYDYMVRDFFSYLIGKRNGYVFAPGTYTTIYLGELWLSRAESAKARAVKACDFENLYPILAGAEWQKIFGTDIPLS